MGNTRFWPPSSLTPGAIDLKFVPSPLYSRTYVGLSSSSKITAVIAILIFSIKPAYGKNVKVKQDFSFSDTRRALLDTTDNEYWQVWECTIQNTVHYWCITVRCSYMSLVCVSLCLWSNGTVTGVTLGAMIQHSLRSTTSSAGEPGSFVVGRQLIQ